MDPDKKAKMLLNSIDVVASVVCKIIPINLKISFEGNSPPFDMTPVAKKATMDFFLDGFENEDAIGLGGMTLNLKKKYYIVEVSE